MHSLITFRSVGIAGLLASCALAACSDGGDEGLLITKNVAVLDVVGGCTFNGTSDELFLSHGTLNVNADGYLLHPQFESKISFDSTDPTSMIQRTVIVNDADIDIAFPDATLFTASQLATMSSTGLTHFKELFSVPVPPLGTADGEVEIIHRPLIDAIVAQNPTGNVEMQISLVANGTMSGATVTSQKFSYAVTLTTGGVESLGACPLPMTTVLVTGNPCNAFQDVPDPPVTCCTGSDGGLECPGTLASM